MNLQVAESAKKSAASGYKFHPVVIDYAARAAQFEALYEESGDEKYFERAEKARQYVN